MGLYAEAVPNKGYRNAKISRLRYGRWPSNRAPSSPVITPTPSRPAMNPAPSPLRTTTSERITAGVGTGTGGSTWFSRAVAAQAVRNSTNWDTEK